MSQNLVIHIGDCREVLKTLPAESVQCCVTSPPYFGLRDYGNAAQIGLESTPDAYVTELVEVFREVRRALRPDGTLWLNLGDSYVAAGGGGESRMIQLHGRDSEKCNGIHSAAGNGQTSGGRGQIGNLRPKQLIGIPWRVAFALQADGWYLRSDIIWHKPNPMPESVTDRPTKAHEYIFLLTKSQRYHYDAEAIAEPSIYGGEQLGIVRGQKRRAASMGVEPSGNERIGADADIPISRNKRSVWTVPSSPYPEAHFATYPPDLIKPCILAGCPVGETVLDPFGGSGTTGMVALELGRKAILIELNPKYAKLAEDRCNVTPGLALTCAVAGAKRGSPVNAEAGGAWIA